MDTMKIEYVWVDGCEPWGMRSKVKVMRSLNGTQGLLWTGLENLNHEVVPDWGFDGSSTEQAGGSDSDCILKPIRVIRDTVGTSDYIVMCEVLDGAGNAHSTNHRRRLVEVAQQNSEHDAWFGLEQEYTILSEGRPLGFPAVGYPPPQGMYYCSAGGDRAFGRQVCDDHMNACINAGLSITGTNAEVMPGQWEYQIGGPGVGAVDVADQLWLSRWMLLKIAERHGFTVTFDPKPMLGDWNGAGCHTNFSTKLMREDGGIKVIEAACNKLSRRVSQHLEAYGSGIERRLTGLHETCSHDEFKWGVADRTASIRIPRAVATDGKGYLEDRRPNANCDPYRVTCAMLITVCTE